MPLGWLAMQVGALGIGVPSTQATPPPLAETGHGRIGIAEVKADATSNFGFSDEGSATSLYLGAGMEWAVIPQLKATAGWDMTRATTDGGRKGFMHLFTVGAQYTY